jgi:hypothetical protein
MKIIPTPHFAPADDGGSAGGAEDRGDELRSTDSDAEADAVAAAAAREAVAAEEAAAEEAAAEAAKAEAEAEGKDGKKDGKKDTRIPLARHEAILTKEREARAELERQLAQYQQGKEIADINAVLTATETKILGMEKEYAKLLTDGDVDKATVLMAEIRRLDREAAESKNDLKIQAAEARATERARYNIGLERVEAAYPELNPDHEDYDAEKLTDVADLKGAYERKGMTPTDALQKAVKKLMGTETKKQEAATEVKPNVSVKDVAAERKKEAVAKALETTKKSPASLAKVGLDSDKDGGTISAADVMKMSYKDFSALPEEQLARMRGDVL